MEKRSFLFVCILTLSFFVINNYIFEKAGPPPQIVQMAAQAEVKPLLISDSSSPTEEFYVLENEYQQLVFSTKGGAIAEINLPFTSKNNPNSVILPIQFDKSIEEQSSVNANFPLNEYFVFENGSSVKKNPNTGGYTPLLRRSLKTSQGNSISEFPSKSYAMNIVSEDGSHPNYKMTQLGEDFIEFSGSDGTRSITKSYKIPKNTPYTFELEVTVDGNPNNLWITSGLLEVELVSGSYSPLLQYYTTSQKEKGTIEKIKLPKAETSNIGLDPLWISNANGFFGIILDTTKGKFTGIKSDLVKGEIAPTRLTLIDKEYDLYPAKDYPAYELLLPYKADNTPHKFVAYAGPYSSKVLKAVDSALADPDNGIGFNPHFSKIVMIQGWLTFITEPFSKFLFILMQFFHMITRSWGLSIIMLTFVLRLMLYPLNAWAYKSTSKMQKLGPKLSALQEKFKSDPKRLQVETAMLYKTEGVNPFSGCLPMLIQFPFLIGMFDLLKSTFELRGVGFIPGWIENLTAPDVLFSWSYPIVFIGTSFHLLPFVLGGLMYLQSKLGVAQQGQKGPLTEQQQQMKTAGNVMTIVFTFMFYNMPSGLNIYWIFSTLFGMLQQWFMIRKFQKNQNILKKT